MKHRLAWHVLVPACLCAIACGIAVAASGFTDAEKHAAEERALRAQVEHMDDDIQKLDNQIYTLEHDKTVADPARIAKEDALREQVHRMNREEDVILARLNELEKQDPPGTTHPPAGQAAAAAGQPDASAQPAPPVPAAPVPTPPPAPVAAPAVAPPPAVPAPVHGPNVRSAADPSAYEKAASDPVSVFHYNPYKWVPVGTRQIAIYNTYDEAFLLDLDGDCPTLLTTERIAIENFSTRVAAGRDGVIADGVRCAITRIRPLHINRLPR